MVLALPSTATTYARLVNSVSALAPNEASRNIAVPAISSLFMGAPWAAGGPIACSAALRRTSVEPPAGLSVSQPRVERRREQGMFGAGDRRIPTMATVQLIGVPTDVNSSYL